MSDFVMQPKHMQDAIFDFVIRIHRLEEAAKKNAETLERLERLMPARRPAPVLRLVKKES